MTKVLYFEGVGMEYEPNQNSKIQSIPLGITQLSNITDKKVEKYNEARS